ncbi:hypothetical protein SAPIO_CDS0758 [Scedosporium apiospermum]|uniref:Uncharacterized protein n=1 Tax=Pseudallescheria apiosperma TaxID=563466 RepID=A0A084GGH1_PSEDA|nr:uncharacterized protein SAPIO_CDS0758 [Scedosporium apiospermum]KEZ46433.1 hypothetical protein SAPIO_CDS0758 [Scedosporium apiospermum]
MAATSYKTARGPHLRPVFTFDKVGPDSTFERYWCFGGNYFRNTPNRSHFYVCFSVSETLDRSSLRIVLRSANLIKWLKALLPTPVLASLERSPSSLTIYIEDLLPLYPTIKSSFLRRKSHRDIDFDDYFEYKLLAHSFLLDYSIFLGFDCESLYKRGILTHDHWKDIKFSTVSTPFRALLEQWSVLLPPELRTSIGNGEGLLCYPERRDLRRAIGRHDSQAVASILENNRRWVDPITLCFAIRSYNPSVFSLLIKHCCVFDADWKGHISAEPLYRAAKEGNLDAVKAMFEAGAGIEGNSFRGSSSPLTGAASGGHVGVVQYLVENGASINSEKMKSPLSRAIKHGHIHIIKYLVEHGARIEWDGDGLSGAVNSSDLDVALYFVKHVHYVGCSNSELLLCKAAELGRSDIVKWLVECQRIDVNSMPGSKTALVLAMENGHCDVANYLVARGARCRVQLAWSYRDDNPDLVAFGLTNPAISTNMTLPALANVPSGPPSAFYTHLGDYCFFFDLADLAVVSEPIVKSSGRDMATVFAVADFISMSHFLDFMLQSRYLSSPTIRETSDMIDVPKACPMETAIRNQERKRIYIKVLKKLARSLQGLEESSSSSDASVDLEAFLQQQGGAWSVFRRAVRVIRSIVDGQLPNTVLDIVDCVLATNAMRSAIPERKMKCPKKVFINDLDRWAALLSDEDQPLFWEISHFLWGKGPSTGQQATPLVASDVLPIFQEVVSNLVNVAGTYSDDDEEMVPGGGTPLHILREQRSHSSPQPHVQEYAEPPVEPPPPDPPDPPDLPERKLWQEPCHKYALRGESEHLAKLAAITVLMAARTLSPNFNVFLSVTFQRNPSQRFAAILFVFTRQLA